MLIKARAPHASIMSFSFCMFGFRSLGPSKPVLKKKKQGPLIGQQTHTFLKPTPAHQPKKKVKSNHAYPPTKSTCSAFSLATFAFNESYIEFTYFSLLSFTCLSVLLINPMIIFSSSLVPPPFPTPSCPPPSSPPPALFSSPSYQPPVTHPHPSTHQVKAPWRSCGNNPPCAETH